MAHRNRTKSLEQLREQARRIVANYGEYSRRSRRALDTFFRYSANIENMRINEKQRQKAVAEIEANGRDLYGNNHDLKEVKKFSDQLNNRQVSRSTYMGISVG